jgi:tetratricopeptide (TPR) repeat protein
LILFSRYTAAGCRRVSLLSALILLQFVNLASAQTTGDDKARCDSTGSPDEVIAACTAVIQSPPTSPTSGDLAGAFAVRAQAYYKKGDFDHAIDDDNQAIERDPKNWQYLRDRAHAYVSKGQPDKALADYDQQPWRRTKPRYSTIAVSPTNGSANWVRPWRITTRRSRSTRITPGS